MSVLIEPWIARAVARRIAGDDSLSGSTLQPLVDELGRAVPRSDELVAESSGIPPPGSGRWEVIDRATWAETNVAGLSDLLSPLEEKVARRLRAIPVPLRYAQRAAVSVEVGLLLGFVSRRVLGQYDLLVAEGGRRTRRAAASVGDDGVLYFVGPNLLETERRFGFVRHEFALWVALHETTHRYQFAGVPWLKQRFLSRVHAYLDSVDLDAGGLARRIAAAARRLASGSVPAEERNPAYLLASDEQRVLLDEIQALMAVVEGHGNYVMDTVGARVIPSFNRMRHLFETRRAQQNLLQKAVSQAIGLEMKLRQYELGQRFLDVVVARWGTDALSYLWADPSHLPTLDELRTPERWLRRVAA